MLTCCAETNLANHSAPENWKGMEVQGKPVGNTHWSWWWPADSWSNLSPVTSVLKILRKTSINRKFVQQCQENRGGTEEVEAAFCIFVKDKGSWHQGTQ